MNTGGVRKPGRPAIYVIALGTMISSGLIVLPAVVYPVAGPGIVVADLMAGLMMLPALPAEGSRG